MKNTRKFLCLCLLLLTFISVASYGAKRKENCAVPKENTRAPENSVNEKALTDALKKAGTDIKNDRKKAKLLKHEIKSKMKESGKAKDRTVFMVILLVILAIIIPPLAVLLVDGLRGPFWLDILLSLLAWLPGIIYALYRVFKD